MGDEKQGKNGCFAIVFWVVLVLTMVILLLILLKPGGCSIDNSPKTNPADIIR